MKLILLLLYLFSFNSTGRSLDFTIEKKSDNTIVYKGDIVKGSYDAIIESMSDQIKFLEISSFGGDSAEAMKIGLEIRQRNIHLVVVSYCFSSCANYLFLAAKTKTVGHNSFLGFHGASSSTLTTEELSEYQSGRTIVDMEKKVNINSPQFVQLNLKMMAIHELNFLSAIDVDVNFFLNLNKKIKTIKLPIGDTKKINRQSNAVLITKDRVWNIKLDDAGESELLRLVTELREKEIDFEVTLAMLISKFGNAGYFPSPVSLENLSIKGIKSFYYPATDIEFQKSIAEIFGSDFTALGDFSSE